MAKIIILTLAAMILSACSGEQGVRPPQLPPAGFETVGKAMVTADNLQGTWTQNTTSPAEIKSLTLVKLDDSTLRADVLMGDGKTNYDLRTITLAGIPTKYRLASIFLDIDYTVSLSLTGDCKTMTYDELGGSSQKLTSNRTTCTTKSDALAGGNIPPPVSEGITLYYKARGTSCDKRLNLPILVSSNNFAICNETKFKFGNASFDINGTSITSNDFSDCQLTMNPNEVSCKVGATFRISVNNCQDGCSFDINVTN